MANSSMLALPSMTVPEAVTLSAGVIRAEVDERAHARLNGLDPVEVGRGGLDRGYLFVLDRPGELKPAGVYDVHPAASDYPGHLEGAALGPGRVPGDLFIWKSRPDLVLPENVDQRQGVTGGFDAVGVDLPEDARVLDP